ncbi:MAG: ABC transporter permease [candidate division WWE3 bacterium]|nr:ABC transporter permease [candidate division WWE3 bacterium]
MNFWDIFIESLSTLTLNKTRTALAILGIVIGIASVIALISLGEGTSSAIQSQIEALGSNLLSISPSSSGQGAVRGGFGGGTTLTVADATAIANSSQVTTISMVSPEVSKRAQVVTGGNNTNTSVTGVTSSYITVHKISIASGRFISDYDEASMAKVAVIGPQVVSDLFGTNDPLGQSIRINNQSLIIIGVTVSKGGTGFLNQDDSIYVPLSTAQKQLFGQSYLNTISVEAKSVDVMTQAQNEIGYLLLAQHKISDPSKADFSILSQQDILSTASSTTGTFTALLSGVAAISLIVGGIGIMNIMLVTVTERTREIGLRKALGARKKTITTQFLTESVILTFSGGLIGVILGIATSYLISSLTSTPFAVSIRSIGLAFIVSSAIGILFGWYPAQRASSLQPIEALRYE